MRTLSELALGEEPVVGEVYVTTCVDMRGVDFSGIRDATGFVKHQDKMVAIPVIGTVHTDPEFGNNSAGQKPHVHVDIRFITEWELNEIWQSSSRKANNPAFVYFPIVPNHYGITVPLPYLHPKECVRRVADFRYSTLGVVDDWDKFDDEMDKHTLNLKRPICPHHGTPLNGQPVRDGIVTCPLHCSTWCAKTGKHVRKSATLDIILSRNDDVYITLTRPWRDAKQNL